MNIYFYVNEKKRMVYVAFSIQTETEDFKRINLGKFRNYKDKGFTQYEANLSWLIG